MAKKVSIAKRAYVTPDGTESNSARPDVLRLEFRWSDGREPLTVSIREYPKHIVNALAWHALSQKIGDAYANSGGDIDWAEAQAIATHQMMVDGDWTRRRESDGVGRATDLAHAIAEVKDTDIASVTQALAAKSKEERKVLETHPKVAAIIARLREERARAKREELASAADDAGEVEL